VKILFPAGKMSLLLRSLIVVGFSVIALRTLPAQAQYVRTTLHTYELRNAADSVKHQLVRDDVERLVIAQERYYADHGVYAAVVDSLSEIKPASGATISLADVTATGWRMTAMHWNLGGEFRLTIVRKPAPSGGREKR
jgi:hypothetical protein